MPTVQVLGTSCAPALLFRSRDYYTTDEHLRAEDNQLFHHDCTSKRPYIRRATRDVERALEAKGVDPACLLDHRAATVVEVTVTAGAAGLNLAQGAVVRQACPDGDDVGLRDFVTVDAIALTAGQSVTVQVAAGDFGEVFEDVEAFELELADDAEATVEVVGVVSQGRDHQLTLATTYRALTLVYLDYMREEGDCFDIKRRMYHKLYDEELRRTLAVGLIYDEDGDGEADHAGRRFALRRMERG